MSEFLKRKISLIGDDLTAIAKRVAAKYEPGPGQIWIDEESGITMEKWSRVNSALAERPVPERQDGPRPSSGNP